MPRALRPRAGRPARRRRSPAASPTRTNGFLLEPDEIREPAAADPGRGARAPRGIGPDGDGRRGLSDLAEVGRGAARARPARGDRQRRRGRAGNDQGPLRDGAAAAASARRARGRDALLRDGRGLHLPPRGVRARSRSACARRSRRAASTSSSSSAPARTSAARRRRCSSRWRAGAGCRGCGRRSRPSPATSAGRR